VAGSVVYAAAAAAAAVLDVPAVVATAVLAVAVVVFAFAEASFVAVLLDTVPLATEQEGAFVASPLHAAGLVEETVAPSAHAEAGVLGVAVGSVAADHTTVRALAVAGTAVAAEAVVAGDAVEAWATVESGACTDYSIAAPVAGRAVEPPCCAPDPSARRKFQDSAGTVVAAAAVVVADAADAAAASDQSSDRSFGTGQDEHRHSLCFGPPVADSQLGRTRHSDTDCIAGSSIEGIAHAGFHRHQSPAAYSVAGAMVGLDSGRTLTRAANRDMSSPDHNLYPTIMSSSAATSLYSPPLLRFAFVDTTS
jgi:hypothetical protein